MQYEALQRQSKKYPDIEKSVEAIRDDPNIADITRSNIQPFEDMRIGPNEITRN